MYFIFILSGILPFSQQNVCVGIFSQHFLEVNKEDTVPNPMEFPVVILIYNKCILGLCSHFWHRPPKPEFPLDFPVMRALKVSFVVLMVTSGQHLR